MYPTALGSVLAAASLPVTLPASTPQHLLPQLAATKPHAKLACRFWSCCYFAEAQQHYSPEESLHRLCTLLSVWQLQEMLLQPPKRFCIPRKLLNKLAKMQRKRQTTHYSLQSMHQKIARGALRIAVQSLHRGQARMLASAKAIELVTVSQPKRKAAICSLDLCSIQSTLTIERHSMRNCLHV